MLRISTLAERVMNPKKMGDYPQNTKKPEGEQKRRYKAAYNQRALRLGLAVREKTAGTHAVPVPAGTVTTTGKASSRYYGIYLSQRRTVTAIIDKWRHGSGGSGAAAA